MRLTPLWIALSAYSVLPVPQREWDEKSMGRALCCLPAVGLLTGGALLFWHWLFRMFFFAHPVLFAAGAMALPALLTGGIHLDGYMDTVDALASHASRERKLAILKDPHPGAFAVIYLCLLLLMRFSFYYALSYTLSPAPLRVVAVGCVYGRALAVWSALRLPPARPDGMLCAFTARLDLPGAKRAMAALLAVCAIAMLALSPMPGALGAALPLLCCLWYKGMAKKQLGGVTGDTTGFLLVLCEFFCLLGVLLSQLLCFH